MPREVAPEVLFVLTDAGGGHRAVANSLIAAAEQQESPLRFRILRLQDALAAADFTRSLLGTSIEEAYNWMVRRGWTRFLEPLLRLLHFLIAKLHTRLVGLLARALAAERPTTIVSLMPNFNAVIRDAARSAHPGVPFLVLLTDYADFPPHFWLETGIDRVIVGSDYAVQQAVLAGLSTDRISRVSGMPLHPRHYAAGGSAGRARARLELGIPTDEFVVMILFGGKGVPEIEPLAGELLRLNTGWHVIAVCGDNPRLLQKVQALAERSNGRLHALGFSDRIADLLAASDVLLTKPGPGSLAEAFLHGVPVVVPCNAATVPQERWNAQMVKQRELGLVVDDWRAMAGAATVLLRNRDWLQRLRTRIQALPRNRAVYEALEIIEAEAGLAGSPPLRGRSGC